MNRRWVSAYDPGVPHSIEYPDVPVYRPFLDTARDHPETVALLLGEDSITYRGLAARVEALAGSLAELGVLPGTKVGILLPNVFETVISYYGVLRCGATAVMLSPALVAREFEMMTADAGFHHLVCDEQLAGGVAASLAGSGVTTVVLVRKDRDARFASVPDDARTATRFFDFADLLAGGSPVTPAPGIDPRTDVAVMIYTGGTTGIPKAVELTHYSVVANAMQLGSWVDYGPGEVVVAALPLFHSYGMSTGINAPLFRGSTSLLLPGGGIRELISAIERARPRLFVGVPVTLAEMLEAPGISGADLSCLECLFVGAAPLPGDVREGIERLTGARVLKGYGLTEAVTAQSANPLRGTNKPGSIGVPFPDVAFRIVDLETGTRSVAPEQVGELTISGPCLMKAYHNRPAETAKALRDGWLYTGDIGWVDRDGYFYMIDRKKDLVIAGAFKAYPAEVESVLATHPDIKESAVVGLYDDFRGHSLKAFVVRRPEAGIDEADVMEFLRANLSEHKVPRAVEFTERLPRSEMGKILRSELE